jgi:hypothetical protein
MADAQDGSGDKEARGDAGFQTRPGRRLEVREADEDPAPRAAPRTPFPVFILVGGILWIQVGAIYVTIFGASRFLGAPFKWTDFWILLGAILFTKDGIQLIRGKAGDPLWDGRIAVLIGACSLVQGWFDAGTPGNLFLAVFNILFGLMFLTPGILVLLGRKAYLAWVTEKAEAEVLAALRAEIEAEGDEALPVQGPSPKRSDEGFTTSP